MLRTVLYVLVGFLLFSSNPAAAQSAKSIVGSWAVTSALITDAAGNKSDTFGPEPQGLMIFTADGRYSLIIMRGDLPPIAANSRLKGTPEEYRAIVTGSNAHFGTYSVDEKAGAIIFNVERATFPNWNGKSQTRPFSVQGDELRYQVPAPSTGSGRAELVWKRLKPAQ
jgi:hypothetical protein